ncbi:hypothetical protein [Paludifilum halophilum]|uniref:Uncharacterized protein n=1 Tax=Paludifilum halophilum TaxID=1642702 RepID=A0A235BC89_9BACL|nr:hypothetical protein [Paludifilum halophilum]OYD09888.1 hypothetical protein CHM34_02620 [Paludifilum halophilum]
MEMPNQNSLRYRGVYTKVPNDPSRWRRWEEMGRVLLEDYRRKNGGELPHQIVCREGEREFPRCFQMLQKGGTLTLQGDLNGAHFTFVGKEGQRTPWEMLNRAGFSRGESLLIFYGVREGLEDPVGEEMIETGLQSGGRLVVATYNDKQKHCIDSRWGGAITGAISLEEVHRNGNRFDWPPAMPYLPDPDVKKEEFREAVRLFQERTVQPFVAALHGVLEGVGDSHAGRFDVVLDRAGHDSLAVSASLVRPQTGRVVYCEDMGGRRYSFYAPDVWLDRRRIEMPEATIVGRGNGSARGGFRRIG